MTAAVDAERDRTIALLERLVNRNSGSLNLEGVRAVGQMMREELEPLGFAVRWVDMTATGRAGHIVATHRGRGRNVLLIGHLDTVFEPESPFQAFERVSPSAARGPLAGETRSDARNSSQARKEAPPLAPVKISRADVYRIMAESTSAIASDTLLRALHERRRLRAN